MASIAGGLMLFLMAGLLYGVLLNTFITTNAGPGTLRTEPIMWLMLVSQLVMGFLLSLVLGRWAGISTFAGGAKAGVLIGLLLGFGISIDLLSFSYVMNSTSALVDPFVWGLRYAVAGGVVGVILGWGKVK